MEKVIANGCPDVYLITHEYLAENVECPLGGPFDAIIEASYSPGEFLVDLNEYEQMLGLALSIPLLVEEVAQLAIEILSGLANTLDVSVWVKAKSTSHGTVTVRAGDFVTRILEEGQRE